jgi:PPE-repeat protein
MDFGLLPPEINSARTYTGRGSGPLAGNAGIQPRFNVDALLNALSYSAD